jgi:hypothetical protein
MMWRSADNHLEQVKVEAKVLAEIRKDLNEVFSSINQPDCDDSIKALLSVANNATGEVLKRKSNDAIDATVVLVYNSTSKTLAFIERNAKNPNSANVLQSKRIRWSWL